MLDVCSVTNWFPDVSTMHVICCICGRNTGGGSVGVVESFSVRFIFPPQRLERHPCESLSRKNVDSLNYVGCGYFYPNHNVTWSEV